MQETNKTTELSISCMAIKPPSFWKVNPTLWFRQLKAQFEMSNVMADTTKFNHVISVIESDIFLHPTANDKYESINAGLKIKYLH